MPPRARMVPLVLCLAWAPIAGCGAPRPRDFAGAAPDSIASAFRRPSAALTRAGATRSFQVLPDGSLYNGVWRVVLHARDADGVEAGPPRVIAYEDRWCPVVRWRRAGAGVDWDFEAVVFPAPADSVLIASLAVRATARAGAAGARFAAGIAPRPADVGWLAPDSPPASSPAPGWTADTEGVAGMDPGAPRGGPPAWSVRLAPGGSHTGYLLLGAYPLPRASLAAAARTPHARRVADVRAEWARTLATGTRLSLGDPELERAWNAARVVLLQNRVRRGDRWLPRGNPFQYADTWLRDGARAVAALAVSGHGRESRQLAAGLAAFQWRSGALLSQRGQLDGIGQALWAFAQAGLRPAPDSSAARDAVIAAGAVGWLREQRERGAASGQPRGTLLPPADPRDGELVAAQLTGNDAWAIAGLSAAAGLLRAAGRGADAASAESLGSAMAADFAQALARVPGRDIPPSWTGPGRDWGNLAVAWPCRAIPASDPRCAALAARVWSRSGIPGIASYGVPDSLHGYVGADLGTWALLADRPRMAHAVLDELLAWRDGTGAGAELFSRSQRDFGVNWPPHPTSAAALVQLARNLLVYDDGDTLQLTLGPRPAWWRGGQVRSAPTRWGVLDLDFARQGVNATWRWTPVAAWSALRLPEGTVLSSIPPPPLRARVGDRTVYAPPGTGSATVTLASAPLPSRAEER